MQAVNTRGATDNYLAPANWKPELDGECGVLEVRVDKYGKSELIQCVSTWKPTAEELVLLLHGAVIELAIIGNQPPVMLSVVEPVLPPKPPERPSIVINEHAHGLDEHGVAYP